MPRVSKAATVKNNNYEANGIHLSPAAPTPGEKVKITYDGLLAKSGAANVFARVGFGDNWSNLYDYRMERTGAGFEAVIPVVKSDTMNVCFKDCANNWDNNSGMNYSFSIM